MPGPSPTESPYVVPEHSTGYDEPDIYYNGPNPRYAVSDHPVNHTTNLGWSPSLRLSAQDIPDGHRLGNFPTRDYHDGTPGTNVAGTLDRDTAKRHSVEKIDANGWDDSKGVSIGDSRWAPHAMSKPVAESRESRHPRSYAFWRSFGNGGYGNPKVGARALNGNHFSMADHKRNYEILGMQPVTSRRNTYRIDPEPWDIDIVDMPPTTLDASPSAVRVGREVISPSRTWRLS